MRAPELGALLPRGVLYEGTASQTLPPAQLATAVASCNDANDFPLSGTCGSTSGAVRIVGGRALNWSSTSVPAQFQCTFFNEIATSQTGTARIMCIGVP